MEYNTEVTVEFLQKYRPNGPWLLIGFSPDGGKPQGVFLISETEARRWIEERQGKLNLYFSVNPTLKPMLKKPKKEDIAALEFLHVDIDPNPNAGREEERERILTLLREFPVRPSFVIDSGNGYQAFFRLKKSIKVGEISITEAEAYNKQIQHELGGDSCHNIDRIMRLPGTLNLPNKKKRELGRVTSPTKLIYAGDESYEISKFLPYLENDKSVKEQISDEIDNINIEKIASIDDLDCSDWVKELIVTGVRKDNPEKYNSRSEALFAVVCELYRCNVSPEIIMGIQLNSDFKISASVLEKGANAEKYARKQIESAIEKNKLPRNKNEVVIFVNRTYFAVQESGKVAIYREEENELEPLQMSAFIFELEPYVLTVQSGNAFKFIPYSDIWRKSNERRYYPRGFVLEPHLSVKEGYYNLWKGFRREPKEGNWSLMQRHILEVLADGNSEYAEYILKWAAWTVQNPSTPPRVALVFKGGEGVGKGTFCNVLVKVFGGHGMRIQDMVHLVGKFNAHLRRCCLLFADEAIVPSSDREGALKGLITEPTIPIERKGFDTIDSPNHLHIMMATNNDWAVPSGADARRFAVFKVSDKYKGNEEYFTKLHQQLENGGLEAMLYDMLAMDLGAWHPEKYRPETKELIKQKEFTLKGVAKMWFDCLKTGSLPIGAKRMAPNQFLVSTKELTDDAAMRTGERVTLNQTANFLGSQMAFEKYRASRPSGYIVPGLNEARQRWNEIMFISEWDEDDAWELDEKEHF